MSRVSQILTPTFVCPRTTDPLFHPSQELGVRVQHGGDGVQQDASAVPGFVFAGQKLRRRCGVRDDGKRNRSRERAWERFVSAQALKVVAHPRRHLRPTKTRYEKRLSLVISVNQQCGDGEQLYEFWEQ